MNNLFIIASAMISTIVLIFILIFKSEVDSRRIHELNKLKLEQELSLSKELRNKEAWLDCVKRANTDDECETCDTLFSW